MKRGKKYKQTLEKLNNTEQYSLEQARRTSLFNRFRQQKIRFMVATDVASRGLDFTHASHVINYDFPGPGEGYTHRTGRTARMGRKGIAFSLVSQSELRTSIKPGVTDFPLRSILRAPAGISSFLPTATIRPSRIKMSPSTVPADDCV